jgi:hypothetical protein
VACEEHVTLTAIEIASSFELVFMGIATYGATEIPEILALLLESIKFV